MTEDWEENLIQQLLDMFKQLGLDMNKEQLTGLIDQVRGQFEGMGIDMERLQSGEATVDAQANMEALAKALSTLMSEGDGIGNLFETMGFKVDVQASTPVTIDPSTPESTDSIDIDVPDADILIHQGRMTLTIDLANSLEEGIGIDLALTDSGRTLQIIKTNQLRPFRRISLDPAAGKIVAWDLNNGILDVELEIENGDGTIHIG
ncbi:MAG TPA: hypothetical protein HA345_06260 [Candidatus Thalassarchaeaceae archaeon]|nr:MAG TPA: hypothetical protein D7H94_06250 [Candidatus Poseidoniales archaeon]HIH84995.1 hypothetical protein [Candidatus Thalassarchaeaceae archaeon]|tara:strand:- start:50 stop:664 length:615 start_codon:yes stop_codon:yes gene_type:complete